MTKTKRWCVDLHGGEAVVLARGDGGGGPVGPARLLRHQAHLQYMSGGDICQGAINVKGQ
jgi:hypothetical protein